MFLAAVLTIPTTALERGYVAESNCIYSMQFFWFCLPELLSSVQADAPPIPGSAGMLRTEQAAIGVTGALIVQPAYHKFDHSYVTHVIKTYPGRFAGCLLADPRQVVLGVEGGKVVGSEQMLYRGSIGDK